MSKLSNIKKIIIIMIILSIVGSMFVACKKHLDEEDVSVRNLSYLFQEEVTRESIEEVEKYLDANASRFNKDELGEMILAFEKYIFLYDEKYVNYENLLEKYGDKVSEGFQKLLLLKIEESKSPVVIDSTIQISWTELLERTYEVEQTIIEYKEDSIVKEDLLWMYDRYMNNLLAGTANTPVFDYETNKFSDKALEAYITFIGKYPDAMLAKVLRDYKDILIDMDYTLDTHNNEAISKFKEACINLALNAEKELYDR